MRLWIWFQAKLLGPNDQTKVITVKEIERQVSKLNGATEKLSHKVRVIQNDRVQNRKAFTDMLDNTLRTPEKDNKL